MSAMAKTYMWKKETLVAYVPLFALADPRDAYSVRGM